jgi:hypothetical protein
MSLKGFQQAIVDLTLAPKSAAALRRGETALLDRYDLTERERVRILAAVAQRGMAITCSLARGNRLEVIAGVFPMTCILLKPVLRGLLDDLWEVHQPGNYQLAGEEEAFAAFIQGRIAEGALSIEYLAEIFAYELTCWEMTRQARASTVPGAPCEARFEFQHQPDQLLPPLSRLLAPPAGLPAGSFPALVRLSESGFEVQAL